MGKRYDEALRNADLSGVAVLGTPSVIGELEDSQFRSELYDCLKRIAHCLDVPCPPVVLDRREQGAFSDGQCVILHPEWLKAELSSECDRSSLTPHCQQALVLAYLAHEMGHHINENERLTTPRAAYAQWRELTADHIVGYLLARFGLALDDVTRVTSAWPRDEEHPAGTIRKDHLLAAYLVTRHRMQAAGYI